ncbi:hypothetical protein RND71_029209 [Anisodus tanguticus]|uniref:RecA family profile 1 domain-containing protein n=1 Tax=Anisodus tanguticus TaxID=243964 RepID=A0AAE1REZ9_9SOLA|nr:hypothetical protein RND71_029209 [Anisodus tanguticus]
MQVPLPNMQALRALHFHKHLLISSLRFTIICKHSRKFHSTPQQHFPNEFTAAVQGWAAPSENPNNIPQRESKSSPNYLGSKGRVYEVTGDGSKKKGKGKSKIVWVCSDCGYDDGQWWGICKQCNGVNTMKRFSEEVERPKNGFEVSEKVTRSWLPHQSVKDVPTKLTDVNKGINQLNWRIPLFGLFGAEVGRVLGGGLVPGCLILVGGDPGVGKSTLLLQIAAIIAEGCDMGEPAPVLYVSGEESVEQIGNRADRMRIGTDEIFLYASTDIEDILEKAQTLSLRALVIDSIQTVYLRGVTGSAGGLSQVKECTEALLRFAKKTSIPVFLIGHVTKSGEIAGPRVLEHIVDVVLYMEVEKEGFDMAFDTEGETIVLMLEMLYGKMHGEKCSSHRLLRSVKNRFGSTDELGVFEMSQSGLQAVSNPSEMFLSEQQSDSEFLAGLAVTVIMDGSRAFLIEIQALCVAGSSVSRQVNGVQAGRAEMIIAVLIKQAGLKLQENVMILMNIPPLLSSFYGSFCFSLISINWLSHDSGTFFNGQGVFLNVVSGVSLSETAGDLAVAAAICSSFLEFPLPVGIAFIGEIGLGGEIRTVPRMDKRINTVAKLGYKKCIIPKSAETSLSALDLGDTEIVACRNLKEMINIVFR